MKMAEALQMKQWNHLLYADRMKDNRRKQGWQASWPGRNQAGRNLARDALFIIQPVSGYKMLQAELVRCNLTSRATTLQNQVYFFFRTLLESNQIRFPKTPHSQSPAWPGGKRSDMVTCIKISWACSRTQHCACERHAFLLKVFF